MTNLVATVEKDFAVTLAGQTVFVASTRGEATQVVDRLNEVIVEAVGDILQGIFRDDTVEGAALIEAIEAKFLTAPVEEPDTRTDAEKRQDAYKALRKQDREFLLYLLAGREAVGEFGYASDSIPHLQSLGLYWEAGLSGGLTPWGKEIAGGVARHAPSMWEKIQDGTYVLKRRR